GCQAERSQHKNGELAMKTLRSRLYDMELQKRQAETDKLDETKMDISFGSQIRSYVMQPYQMIKDHRTKFEVGDVNRVLDGDLDPFIRSYLMAKKTKGRLDVQPDDNGEPESPSLIPSALTAGRASSLPLCASEIPSPPSRHPVLSRCWSTGARVHEPANSQVTRQNSGRHQMNTVRLGKCVNKALVQPMGACS